MVPPVVMAQWAAAAQWAGAVAQWAGAPEGPRLEMVVMGAAHCLLTTPGKVLEMLHLVRHHS